MNWLKNFKPKMIIWKDLSCGQLESGSTYVRPVCAKRVLEVRYKIAVRAAKGDKIILRLLRGSDER